MGVFLKSYEGLKQPNLPHPWGGLFFGFGSDLPPLFFVMVVVSFVCWGRVFLFGILCVCLCGWFGLFVVFFFFLFNFTFCCLHSA